MRKIQFTSGCPNGCEYCYEPKVVITLDPVIPDCEEIQILDMNLLANPNAWWILDKLPYGRKFELVCGVDYRRMNQGLADLFKAKGFIKIRWAWDYNYGLQKTHKKVRNMFVKAGFDSRELSIFILANWKIPFVDCVRKLDVMKVWNVKINDCCWDGGYKRAKPVYWTPEQIKRFRCMCRKHNQLVRFGIDPDWGKQTQNMK